MKGPRTLMVGALIHRPALCARRRAGREQRGTGDLVRLAAGHLREASSPVLTLPDNGQPMLLLDAAGIAQSAKLPLRDAQRGAVALLQPPAGRRHRDETIQALVFAERDGTRRLIRSRSSTASRMSTPSRSRSPTSRAFIRIDGKSFPRAQCRRQRRARPVKSLRLHAGREVLCHLCRRRAGHYRRAVQARVVLNGGSRCWSCHGRHPAKWKCWIRWCSSRKPRAAGGCRHDAPRPLPHRRFERRMA